MGIGRIIIGTVAIASLACDRPSDPEEVAEAPEITVELFGRGTISTELPEFATSFSPAGDTIYFNRTPADRSTLELFFAVRTDGEWSPAELFSATSGEVAIDPFVSLDGQRVYFSSNRPREDLSPGSFNLWYVVRTDTGWTEPQDVGSPINSDSSDVFNSFAADGRMVFSSTRGGSRRVYSSKMSSTGWSPPEELSFGEVAAASNPAISPDGSLLVISVFDPGSPSDLFVSCWTGTQWTAAQRLPAPINSDQTEFAPAFSGEYLYFTSERPGVVGPRPDSVRPPGDIYRTGVSSARRMCEGS